MGDLDKEKEFRLRIEAAFNCQSYKLPVYWEIDCILTRQKHAVALAEIKHRAVGALDFPTVFFPCHKWETYQKRYYWASTPRGGNLPLLFFVRFRDGDRYAKISNPTEWQKEKLKAANHADDPTDVEWVYHVPKEEFKEF